MQRIVWLLLLSLGLGGQVGQAQQLSWERPINFVPSTLNALGYAQQLSNGDFLVNGLKRNGATAPFVYARVQPGGQVVYQRVGRTLANLTQELVPLGDAGHLLVASLPAPGASSFGNSRLFFQRLRANGDTLPGVTYPVSLLAGFPVRALREGDSMRVLFKAFGRDALNPERYALLTTDTAGTVGTVRIYDNTIFSAAYPCDLVRTPRGGWLLAGTNTGVTVSSPYSHPYLVETNSQGQFRRLRNLQLFASGNEMVVYGYNNLVRLRDGGGYVFSGHHEVNNQWWGFLCKLDTALNVVWTYRHPPQATSRVQSTRVYEQANGTLGWLLGDEGGAGYPRTPNLYFVQVSASGQLLSQRTVSSAACSQLLLYSWLPLAGGGALVVGGLSTCTATGSASAAYVARIDQALPLAVAAPAAAGSAGAAQLWPNPASASETVSWQGAVRAGATSAELLVRDALGRQVGRVAVAGRGAQLTQVVPVAGLAPGAYAVRLLVDGVPLGPPVRLLVGAP